MKTLTRMNKHFVQILQEECISTTSVVPNND